MAKKEKKTTFIILGFLLNESLTGYEMGEKIKQSTNNFWQESDASIYPTLKLLAKEGLVTSEIAQVGGRKKEVFTITSFGKETFLEWFARPPDIDRHRCEFLLKLFFTNKTTKLQMQQHLREKLENLKKLHEKYKNIEKILKNQLPQSMFKLKTLQIGIAHLELDLSLLKNIGNYDDNYY